MKKKRKIRCRCEEKEMYRLILTLFKKLRKIISQPRQFKKNILQISMNRSHLY